MPELNETFRQLRQTLSQFEGYFTVTEQQNSKYELWSQVHVVINGVTKEKVFFAGLLRHSSYVGFYFMPIYVEQELLSVFSSNLLLHKRGLSCFHFREVTPELLKDVTMALVKGYELYKLRGWVLTTA